MADEKAAYAAFSHLFVINRSEMRIIVYKTYEFNYKIIVSYDGAKYNGWQRLSKSNFSINNFSLNNASSYNVSIKDSANSSIQGILEAAISEYLGTAITITGSGRTDAGVSAVAQTANFLTHLNLKEQNFLKNFPQNVNALLPEDIIIKSIEPVPLNFHSRKSAVSKTYGYYISLDSKPDVFAAKHIYNPALPPVMYNANSNNNNFCCQNTPNMNSCCFQNNQSMYNRFCQIPVNIQAMQNAARFLTGTHKFSAFTTDKTSGKSHVRTINYIDLSIIYTPSSKPVLAITINGDGFLYNMVRIIAGTLLCIGLGTIAAEDIPSILRSQVRKNAGPTLPSNGLFLLKVLY